MSDADLLATELRKAIRVEPGDYIVIADETKLTAMNLDSLGVLGDELWRQGIRLHTVLTSDVDAVRFVRVETPETIQVEET